MHFQKGDFLDFISMLSSFGLQFYFCSNFRKKSLKLTKLAKSTLPSLTVLMTCPAWLISMMLVSCGILLWDTRMSSSTPTQVSFVLPSIHISVSPSTLSAPWNSTSEKEGTPTNYIFLYKWFQMILAGDLQNKIKNNLVKHVLLNYYYITGFRNPNVGALKLKWIMTHLLRTTSTTDNCIVNEKARSTIFLIDIHS